MFEIDDSDAPIEKSERVRRVRANFEHLLDLKRAGCSARFCELVVDRHDRIIAQPMRRPTRGRQ